MHYRLLLSALALLLLLPALPAQAQRGWTGARVEKSEKVQEREQEAPPSPRTWQHKGTIYRPQGRPVETTRAVPQASLPPAPALKSIPKEAVIAQTSEEAMSDPDVLRHLSQLYQLQSEILMAQSEGDADNVDAQFELAMTQLGDLLGQPGITENPRFRELYRSLVTEYEKYYDIPADSLAIQRGDVFELRADLFTALNDLDEPLLEDVALPKLEPVGTTIEMTMNRLVEQSIAFLLRSPENHLYHWLSRADTYFPMIEQIFKEEGVPDELKYLAMVESGINPRAASWAKAVGMWQFIAATGQAYGLQVNAWADERMDPEKATRAAAKHLKDLYQMYDKDWQIAIAGYNCSPRCIKRAIRQSGKANATFWDIFPYLPSETRNYVPMFIAAALVTSNPEAFNLNMDAVQPGPRYAYDYVPVQGMLSLETIAEAAGTDVRMIKALNPELRRETLPPTNDPYYVRIPHSAADRFVEAYAALPEDARRGAAEYVVKRGDTLSKIAKRYAVTVAALQHQNGLRSSKIKVGQRLTVPVPLHESRAAIQLTSTDPVSVQYGPRATRPIAAAAKIDLPEPRTSTPVRKASTTSRSSGSSNTSSSASSETRVVYTVRRGDNLSTIAREYGVSVRDLQGWNKLSSTRIRSGQRLYLYPGSGSAPAAPTTYTVRRGDNLTAIAKKHGVTVSNLRSWNNLNGSRIVPGQKLKLHASAPTTHQVRRGENLTTIARKYGVTVSSLRNWNNLSGSRIVPGQKLKVSN